MLLLGVGSARNSGAETKAAAAEETKTLEAQTDDYWNNKLDSYLKQDAG